MGNPEACRLRRLALLPLTVTSTDLDGTTDPDHAVGDEKSDRESVISATAKLLLRTAKESADALPALKSVLGGLCSILDNFEVRITSGGSLDHSTDDRPSERRATSKR